MPDNRNGDFAILFAPDLGSEERLLIEEEVDLHTKVKFAVRDAALEKLPDMGALGDRVKELRDEAMHASERDLPALFQALATQHSLASRDHSRKLPDMRSPYFGRMVLEEEGKQRNVLLGYQTFIDTKAGISIVDWRHAAIAKIFFNYKEGEEYEIELPRGLSSGRVVLRRVISFEVGRLVGVQTPDVNLRRVPDGAWHRTDTAAVALSGGQGKSLSAQKFGVGETRYSSAAISALLSQEQFSILSREHHHPLLVLGGAGCGKTTVALHRMAMLHYDEPNFFTQRSMQVIVPEQGLVRLSQRLLRNLQLSDVGVSTFDHWVERQARKVIRGLTAKLCMSTPSRVVFVKRHPAMSRVMDAYLERKTNRFRLAITKDLPGNAISETDFDEAKGSLWARLNWCEKLFLERAANTGSAHVGKAIFKEWYLELEDFDTARSELFADEQLAELMISLSDGAITKADVKLLAEHTRNQFLDPDGGQLTSRDRRYLKELDGSEIEEDEIYQTVDAEDFPILLAWLKKLRGKVELQGRAITKISHLLVDEAQDLAPIELEVLGASLSKNSAVTVAGDEVQQSDDSVSFLGWDRTLQYLGVKVVAADRLTTNYRCPRPIAHFAHQLLGDMAPSTLPQTLRDGVPVAVDHFAEAGVAMTTITERLDDLLRREPRASVAIISRDLNSARNIYEGLQGYLPDLRFVPDGEFSFTPGVDLTDVAQIKGLEFDYVIIPDASIGNYPDTPTERRAFHVAATRAIHQLWVCSVGVPSPLLPVGGEGQERDGSKL